MHVAIIMDGNGRWAEARGETRVAGHRAGAAAVRRAVEAARKTGISILTLYAFSGDNWGRPQPEVQTLLALFADYLREETPRCVEHGIRLRVIGRRDRLPPGLVAAIEAAESATDAGRDLDLRIAIDYSSRHEILRAAARSNGAGQSRPAFSALLGGADVDLLIRTGGEQRLSDFLLWECAYAELLFTPRMWPEFTAADLEEALGEFARRERRFGRLPSVRPTSA